MARDLIVFAEDWGGLPSSTQHLIKHLFKTRKILWVNSIGLRKPRLNLTDVRRAWHKASQFIKQNTETDTGAANEQFKVLSPISLPAPESKVARSLASWMLLKQVKPVIDSMGLHDPVLWLSLPTAVDLQKALPELPSVYYCGDDFSGLAGVDHRTVVEHEKELVEVCDLVVAASEPLKNKFPQSKTELLSHGVDLTLFSTRAPRAMDLPDNGRPTAGFYGSLSQWLDQELLAKVIATRCDWNFVFIGTEQVDLSRLKQFSNTFFLGPKPHEKLPSYSQHWDASLLPFVDNAQIRSCNPLKLKEYIAAGRPIIATQFPAVTSLQKDLHVVASAHEFEKTLNDIRQQLTHKVVPLQTISQDSWAAKAQLMGQWVDAL